MSDDEQRILGLVVATLGDGWQSTFGYSAYRFVTVAARTLIVADETVFGEMRSGTLGAMRLGDTTHVVTFDGDNDAAATLHTLGGAPEFN